MKDDVWSALTLMAGSDGTLPEPGTVNQIAFSWLHVPRVPYVKVTRDYEKLTAEVEQVKLAIILGFLGGKLIKLSAFFLSGYN